MSRFFSLASNNLASAEAYMRGLERRVSAGLSPDVRSVASVFLSRWDGATRDKVPDGLRDKLGIAIGQQVYGAYRDMRIQIASSGWRILVLDRSGCSLPVLAQGSQGIGCSLYQRTCCAEHDYYDAGEDSACVQ